ncbi:MAG: pyrimidine 5'-nucleotidase [Alphaproteobacteria bacterium]|nr:pyrimidine 5'-nucleotidase [Alphaproteobacteria bacterium]
MKPPFLDAWLFDLDNTLYPAESGLFEQIRARIGTYLVGNCGVNPADAAATQQNYRERFGSTLAGLMAENRVEPEHFLSFVHDVNYETITPCPRLAHALAGLPGRLFIFTNGSRDHASRVTDRLGISDVFEDIFDIARAGYIPKPMPGPYRDIVRDLELTPRKTAFVEDIERNLAPAKALGMTTILVSDRADNSASAAADYIVSDLSGWLEDFVPPPS